MKDTIFERLQSATEQELQEICESLKIKCTTDVNIISKKYRAAAGHSVGNVFRSSHQLPYKKILIAVANKLKPGFRGTDFEIDDNHREEEIEDQILEYLRARFSEKLVKLSEEKREYVEKIFLKELERRGYSQAVAGTLGAAVGGGVLGSALATPVATWALLSTYSSLMAFPSITALFLPSSLFVSIRTFGVCSGVIWNRYRHRCCHTASGSNLRCASSHKIHSYHNQNYFNQKKNRSRRVFVEKINGTIYTNC